MIKNKKFSVIKTQYLHMLNFNDLEEDNVDTLRYSNDGLYVIILGKIKDKNWIDDIPEVIVIKDKDVYDFLSGDNWISTTNIN